MPEAALVSPLGDGNGWWSCHMVLLKKLASDKGCEVSDAASTCVLVGEGSVLSELECTRLSPRPTESSVSRLVILPILEIVAVLDF
jgi:hypothetical protein